eukprot:CAMPEP_0201498872 /NCGR_PEP_ID=MMETSP0151_2-20130828/73410_1 /ASSEMBLY_ACC=CAM_ASM_000257 /TAXON_ID=200890 /ORGANISM="Paramoeba atlantica, Strain 621/1 / CCAP 1560/9" /LENGTH=91 /DNA_ID=CAMNT_0047890769 /DNA_START=162 /DNA_END=433 /DNA_ORIENTATION=-
MAFRSLLELVSSGISPPPHQADPYQVQDTSTSYVDTMISELRKFGEYGNPVSKIAPQDLKNTWKEFLDDDELKELESSENDEMRGYAKSVA